VGKLQGELSRIQKSLNAPKGQTNKFGKYKYRSCEDILEGLKKVVGDCIVTLSDCIELIGDRVYIKSVATISLGEESISVTGYAREAESKKGMDSAQVTGATSSYSRKYALNGLFMIDDNKDPDTNESRVQATNAFKDPAMPAIEQAIQTKDIKYIHENWQGCIAASWSNLNAEQINQLNILIKEA